MNFAPRDLRWSRVRFIVSPDGGSILYSTYTTQTGLWMLEGFKKP